MRRAAPTLRRGTNQRRLRDLFPRVSPTARAWSTKLSAISRDSTLRSGDTHNIPQLSVPYQGVHIHVRGTIRSC